MIHPSWRYVVIPLAMLVAGELAARFEVGPRYWYEELARAPSPIADVVVLGDSMAAAALWEEVLAADLRDSREDPKPRVRSMATGGATLVGHYLGLRNRLEKDPEALRDSLVLIQARDGVPSPETWRGRWSGESVDYNVFSQLTLEDLPRYLASEASAEQKARAIATFPVRQLRMVLFRRDLHAKTQHKLEVLALRGARRLGVLQPEAPAGPVDLEARAGIRVGGDAISAVRDWVLATEAASPVPPRHEPVIWNRTVLADLVRLLGRAGARPVMVSLPVTRYRQRASSPEGRAELRAGFVDAARRWGVPVVEPDFAVSEEDFPDLVHLSVSSGTEFSSRVAQELKARGLFGGGGSGR